MAKEKYILVRHYCQNSPIEDSFISQLQEYGLVKFEQRENEAYLDEKDIEEIERFFRLHRDLGINYEGLGAIRQMLKRMAKMEREMESLRRRLRFYE